MQIESGEPYRVSYLELERLRRKKRRIVGIIFAVIFMWLLASVFVLTIVRAAEVPVDKELELLNEKKAKLEAQIQLKNYEIRDLVEEYKRIMVQINARKPPVPKVEEKP